MRVDDERAYARRSRCYPGTAFGDLFPGAPTLEAQYVLKDIVLVIAGLVIAARALGARLVAGEPSATGQEPR